MTDAKEHAVQIAAQGPVNARWRKQLYETLQSQELLEIDVPEASHCFAPALCAAGRLILNGNLGDYAFSNLENTDITVRGDVGYAAAQAMRSGFVHVTGSAGPMFAANSVGGAAIIDSDAGACCGANAADTDIFVIKNVGARAGYKLRSGVVVVGGDCGDELGYGATGGVFYVRGKASCVAKNLYETRMREPDRLRLSLILVRANVSLSPKDFRVYKPE